MDIKNKPLLNFDEQISHLLSKNIKFKEISKEEAKEFLQNNNYFFKLKSYAKNFAKDNKGFYDNLDFAYLIDLSTIDMYIRRFILELCLNIEHLLKVEFLKNVINDNCDGYEIVDDFLAQEKYAWIKDKLAKKLEDAKKKSYTYTAQDNILLSCGLDLSAWNFIEIMDFGDCLNFYKFYYDKYPNKKYKQINPFLIAIRTLRNLSAHNNCIINNLNSISQFSPNKNIVINMSKYLGYSYKKLKLNNPIIYDFLATIMVFNMLCKLKKMRKHTYKEIIHILRTRVRKNARYYKGNTLLTSSYIFVARFLVNISKSAY